MSSSGPLFLQTIGGPPCKEQPPPLCHEATCHASAWCCRRDSVVTTVMRLARQKLLIAKFDLELARQKPLEVAILATSRVLFPVMLLRYMCHL